MAMVLVLCGCAEDDPLALVGTVERTAFELAAPVSEAIVELPAEIGEHVETGEVVVRLDDEAARAELWAAEAALAAASATLVAAERDFARFRDLGRKRAASVTQLDTARRVRDEAQAVAAERRARVTQAQKHLRDLTIRSPAAGIVDQRPFDLGERVPAGVVVAVVLADESPWVRIWLPSRMLAQLGDIAAARVRVEGYQREFRGQIRDVAHEPEFTPHYALTERESAHLVYRARIALEDAPADLRPGLASRVRIEFKP